MRPTVALVLVALVTIMAYASLQSAASQSASQAALSQGDLSQARPITLGPSGAEQGSLEQPGEARLYRLDVVAGRTYVIETFDVQAGPGTWLTVYDAGGRFLISGITGSGDADRGLDLVAQADAPVYLRVTGRDGWVGDFSLRALARFDQPGAAWGADLEPNDWCQLATLLRAGADPELHAIQAGDPSSVTHYPDVDSYRIRVEAGKTYEVRVAGLPPGSRKGAVAIYLHDIVSGEYVSLSAHSRSTGATASLVHHFAESGEVCARVAGTILPTPWSGPYTIQLCEGRCRPTLYLPQLVR